MRTYILEETAKAIETAALAKEDIGFNMNYFCSTDHLRDQSGHDCGTVACIAGWISLMYDTEGNPVSHEKLKDPAFITTVNNMGSLYALEVLGVEEDSPLHDELHYLFYPPSLLNYDSITPADAVTTIRNYLTTGKVDWSHVEED